MNFLIPAVVLFAVHPAAASTPKSSILALNEHCWNEDTPWTFTKTCPFLLRWVSGWWSCWLGWLGRCTSDYSWYDHVTNEFIATAMIANRVITKIAAGSPIPACSLLSFSPFILSPQKYLRNAPC